MLFLLIPLALNLFACDGAAPTPTTGGAPANLDMAPVEAAVFRPELELTGSLEPVASVQLGFDVPGRLATLLVTRGQLVERGQALGRLDTSMASAQLAQAEAAVKGAQAQLEAGEASFARAVALYEAKGMSEQQFADAKAGIEAGRAGVEQARAALRLAKTNVGFHTLISPIAGVVTNAPDNPGMVVGAGMPLFLVADLSTLQLKGTAPESATWLREGLDATVVGGSGVSAPGKVSRVLDALDPMTRRLPVELVVSAPPEGLRAYTFARATIQSSQDAGAWSVPATAVVARPEFVVFAVREGGDPSQPVKVNVELIRKDGDRAIVTGALTASDRVLSDPPSGLGVE